MNNNLEKPQQITFDITDRCQMKCVTCSKWKTTPSDVISKELTTDEWKKVLSDLRNWLGEGFWFCFSGGEPFLRQDIFELAEYADSLGIKVASMSNAFSIQNLYEKIINSPIQSLNISLNAVNNPVIHDESRGRHGSYEKALDAIMTLKKLRDEKHSSLGINIATIVFPENIEEVIPLVEFVTKNKINGIMFQLLDDKESFHGYNYQKGCNTSEYKMPKELRAKYKNMAKRAAEVINRLVEMKMAGHSIYNSYEQLEAMKVFFNNPDDILKEIKCDVGSTNYAIDPYGDVRLCFNMLPVGNIKENLPEEIWNSEKAKKCRDMTKSCKMYCRMLNCNFKHNFANFNKSFIHKCKNKILRILTGKC
ncbi:MAG: radical SAM protein [Candidatus Gastranaerophilales bacterium]|nr:radical SAM protein [Candidatus Gastranaerophilales bacterium]